jgi:hypothetical protein
MILTNMTLKSDESLKLTQSTSKEHVALQQGSHITHVTLNAYLGYDT